MSTSGQTSGVVVAAGETGHGKEERVESPPPPAELAAGASSEKEVEVNLVSTEGHSGNGKEGEVLPETEEGHSGNVKEEEVLPETEGETGSGKEEEVEPMEVAAVKSTEGDMPSSPENQEGLTQSDLIDKIKGVIYGQAIGDAYGLATEFMSKVQAKMVYGKDGPSSYADIYQDRHRGCWACGDWTDDTDQMLLILQMICEKGKVDKCDFAVRMLNWMYRGFPELGDKGGCGIGMTVYQTMTHKSFKSNPHAAAKEVWEKSGCYLAANGAVMRTSILGVVSFDDLQSVKENTEEICKTTHADPRCLASCIAVTTAIALMLQGKFKGDPDALTEHAMEYARSVLTEPSHQEELKKSMLASSLDELQLDEANAIGYTFKTLGAGFYGLKSSDDFMTIIKDVTMEAGDADTNGAVCGALVGCHVGFSRLPQNFLTFPHRQWLDNQVDRFLKTIGLWE